MNIVPKPISALLALLIAAATMAFSAMSGTARAQTAAAGKIAFASNRADLNSEIYLMNADGTGVQRLTYNPAADTQPSLSPDGSKVVFVSNRDGGSGEYEIYAVNVDGTGLQRLTDNGANNGFPVWSPDGAHIAFCSTLGGTEQVYVMDASGANAAPITTADFGYISWVSTPGRPKNQIPSHSE